MRIVIDTERCQANARCVVASPEVFDVDDDGYVFLLQADPPPELTDSIRLAARSCPTAAISLVE
jgi:ferredoxin